MDNEQDLSAQNITSTGDERVWASLNAAAWYLGDSIDHLRNAEEKTRARLLMLQVFALRREIEKRMPWNTE